MKNKLINLFGLYLFIPLALLAEDGVSISADTENFFKKELANTCKKKISADFYTEYYFKCTKEEFSKGKIDGYCKENLDSRLKTFNCSNDLLTQFYQKLGRDALPIHKKELDKIKAEIADFKAKKLNASFQYSKYMNYLTDNQLVNLELDKGIVSEFKNGELERNKRKETCRDVINVKEPLSLSRPKNQDTIGWCYSYTASDLVAHVLGKEPSAVHMATLMNDKFLFKMFGVKEGGFTDSVIKEMIDEGMCLEKDLPSTDYKFVTRGYDLKKLFDEIVELSKKYYQSPNHNSDDFPLTKNNEFSENDVLVELCTKRNNLLRGMGELFPNASLNQISEILLKSDPSTAFKKITDLSCPIEKGSDVKSLKVKTVGANEKIFSTIDDQLSKGNILGLHYTAEFLYDYKSGTTFANHASSIVGRRFNPKTQSCEYLLRNSWGKECGSYNRNYECRDGHVWIAEDFFKYKDAIKEVIYVEKK